MAKTDLTIADIEARLRANACLLPKADPFPKNYFRKEPRAASVLVPLFRENDEWNLLFIRRTEHVSDRHSGQVAFPGGKVDAEDNDAVAAALRECKEEIGVAARQINVLGCLKNYRTVSNYLVTPVIATIDWPVDLSIDNTEVDRVFSIPLSWLSDPANFQIKERLLPQFDVSLPVYYYQRYQGELLWGITAKITVSLLMSLGFRFPSAP